LTGMMNNLASYMRDYWQNYRRGQQQARGAGVDATGDDAFVDEETFTPPVDIFSTPTGWTIHLAIPGAKKQDVAVHWDADNSLLVVSGIVYRPGDEQFLSGMVSGERRVGLFERKIELPPAGGEGQVKDEVDGNRITAKLEDGVLVVVVGKAEKEWTEVRKVDIE
jgi:HSP20 family protein